MRDEYKTYLSLSLIIGGVGILLYTFSLIYGELTTLSPTKFTFTGTFDTSFSSALSSIVFLVYKVAYYGLMILIGSLFLKYGVSLLTKCRNEDLKDKGGKNEDSNRS